METNDLGCSDMGCVGSWEMVKRTMALAWHTPSSHPYGGLQPPAMPDSRDLLDASFWPLWTLLTYGAHKLMQMQAHKQ